MSNMGNGWIGDKSMREKAITNQILKYLKSIPECFAFKEHGGIYGVSGLPDIICCYKGKFVAFEVKTEKGRLSKLQEFMITKINGSGGMAFKVTSLQEVKYLFPTPEATGVGKRVKKFQRTEHTEADAE